MNRKGFPVAPMQPLPNVLKKRVYTKEEVAAQNSKKVNVRRQNEDRRKKDAS